ncbi:hypothetical protein N5079_33795 [Planotetraspora sp. A-T 1434]|uniref:hypothetical protein n=1 Tax=Planotetraspora sp. A-T 1434 TaxID=2979219 RepID=UPI0021C0453F|nr:hypothetical protein [Planotetraspora sp. A-T 1434]MCT9935186.1 hypothetical protein [Planotetraspora sp. A-T 1434]
MSKRLNAARAVVMLCVAATTVMATGAADAATSSMIVYHASGAVAGEVWFNSGTTNMSKGRNSFTVRDRFCDDGWMVYAEYKKSSWNNPLVAWRYTDGASCNGGDTELSVSISGDVTRQKFIWRGCKQSEHDFTVECEDYVSDYLD